VVLFGTWTFVITTEAVEKFLKPLTALNIGADIEISGSFVGQLLNFIGI
jgi:hypothetical protein